MITTKQDWWDLLIAQWDNILSMANDQLDFDALAYEKPGNPETPMTGRNILDEMVFLKETEDPKLSRYINAIWNNASDSYAYSKPGWSQLCDLCSECDVLWEG